MSSKQKSKARGRAAASSTRDEATSPTVDKNQLPEEDAVLDFSLSVLSMMNAVESEDPNEGDLREYSDTLNQHGIFQHDGQFVVSADFFRRVVGLTNELHDDLDEFRGARTSLQEQILSLQTKNAKLTSLLESKGVLDSPGFDRAQLSRPKDCDECLGFLSGQCSFTGAASRVPGV